MVNFAIALDYSALGLLKSAGVDAGPQTFGYALLKLKVSEVAPILPFLLLVLMLVFRPRGLLGTRED
jgi:branched-chain amino acid transport system permease protein